jgi:hypothetical protein
VSIPGDPTPETSQQGVKVGQSNQDHWATTPEVKDAVPKRRRLQAKEEIAARLTELKLENETELSSQEP